MGAERRSVYAGRRGEGGIRNKISNKRYTYTHPPGAPLSRFASVAPVVGHVPVDRNGSTEEREADARGVARSECCSAKGNSSSAAARARARARLYEIVRVYLFVTRVRSD